MKDYSRKAYTPPRIFNTRPDTKDAFEVMCNYSSAKIALVAYSDYIDRAMTDHKPYVEAPVYASYLDCGSFIWGMLVVMFGEFEDNPASGYIRSAKFREAIDYCIGILL